MAGKGRSAHTVGRGPWPLRSAADRPASRRRRRRSPIRHGEERTWKFPGSARKRPLGRLGHNGPSTHTTAAGALPSWPPHNCGPGTAWRGTESVRAAPSLSDLRQARPAVEPRLLLFVRAPSVRALRYRIRPPFADETRTTSGDICSTVHSIARYVGRQVLRFVVVRPSRQPVTVVEHAQGRVMRTHENRPSTTSSSLHTPLARFGPPPHPDHLRRYISLC